MKFFPMKAESRRIVAPSSAHFRGPFTIKHPNTNRNITNAPTYTGPAVHGCSPNIEATVSKYHYTLDWPLP